MRNAAAALITAILLATAAATAAPAPPATGPDGAAPAAGAGAGMMLDRARQAVDQLKLTPEQKTKIDKIFKDARGELEQMKTQLESIQPRDRMAEVRDFFDGVRADLALVLTPEQREQIQQKFEQMRDLPNAMPPPGMIADRLRESIPKLNLSDEQLRKVRDLFDDIRPRGEALRQQLESGDTSVRAKLRDLGQETREKLREILTPEQQDKLREMIRQPLPERGAAGAGAGRGGAGGRNLGRTAATTRSARGGAGDKGDQMSDMTMSSGDTMMEGAAASRRPKSPQTAGNAATKPSAGPAVGDAAPEFTLNKLDGAQVSLASMKGRVIVLVFGSYSAPTFRNRAPGLEKLRSDLGTRATFFVVYSREAYPTGDWEISRNKDDGISVEQPRSIDARKSAAITARDKLKLTTPIILDTIGNDTATAYGAGVNSAYVIGRDGTIVARQQWFEPIALRRALDAATATTPAKPATRPANG